MNTHNNNGQELPLANEHHHDHIIGVAPIEMVTAIDFDTNVGSTNTNAPFMNINDHDQPQEFFPEFDYLEKLIRHRLNNDFPSSDDEQGNKRNDHIAPPCPPVNSWHLSLNKFVKENGLENKQDELILLLVALMPHVKPDFFDSVIEKKIKGSGDYPKLGGVRHKKNCRFFLPTGETALFIIAGENFRRRQEVQQLFSAEHLFWEKKITWLEDMQNEEPSMHGRLIMAPDYIDLLTYGEHKSPQFSISFPAKKIGASKKNGSISFDQLVVSKELIDQIGELKSWLKYNDNLVADFSLANKFRKGYRALFYGPPGTGKTFTAQILGNDLKKDVYKIDLSMIVSKYIGETEKNLELLFARAEDKGWILFFDEADALFGKRTNVRDAHDKYANQEVSYLLQRIEDYNGLVILATNMKNNIDDAFIRRFNSILKFNIPNAEERSLIWDKLFPPNRAFRDKLGKPAAEEFILEAVKNFELTGGNINNIVHYACLKAYEKRVSDTGYADDKKQEALLIYLEDIENGIKKEVSKEGKPFVVNNR